MTELLSQIMFALVMQYGQDKAKEIMDKLLKLIKQ